MSDQPPGVGALAMEVARLHRELTELRGAVRATAETEARAADVERLREQLGELARTVADLSEQLSGGDDNAARPVRAPVWPALQGEALRTNWKILFEWTETVLKIRQPDAYNKLTPCWYLHPDVVDELSALRVAWWGAYRVKSPLATAPLEWHDRWLPGCVARVTRALSSCKGQHEPSEPRRLIRTEDFAAFVDKSVTDSEAP